MRHYTFGKRPFPIVYGVIKLYRVPDARARRQRDVNGGVGQVVGAADSVRCCSRFYFNGVHSSPNPSETGAARSGFRFLFFYTYSPPDNCPGVRLETTTTNH